MERMGAAVVPALSQFNACQLVTERLESRQQHSTFYVASSSVLPGASKVLIRKSHFPFPQQTWSLGPKGEVGRIKKSARSLLSAESQSRAERGSV